MKKKLLFIYNAYAGKGKIREVLADILEIFAKAGYQTTVSPTLKQSDAVEIVETMGKDYELIVCSGGDGTLDEVVTGHAKANLEIPIGYIPAGSTNDYANSLCLPKNMVEAAKIAVSGQLGKCDMGLLDESVFVYIAAFGAFTDVSYETPQVIKNVLGHAAYILEGMKKLPSIRAYHMRVRANDKEIEDDFIFGMVTNSISVGGFKNNTTANVVLDDGLFEVTLIKHPKNPIELQSIISSLLINEFDSKYMYDFKADHIEFYPEDEIPWTLDGEFGGNRRETVIENHARAIPLKLDISKISHLIENQ